MRFLSRLKIAHKLGLAACLFAVPIGFLVTELAQEQNIAITFVTSEVAGARLLADLAPLQAGLALASLAGAASPAAAAAQVAALPVDKLDIGAARAAASAALHTARNPAALADARARLRDLIARIGDRSNLILDNVLATYYLTDVVLNPLPDAMDQLADLQRSQNARAGADDRARFLVGVGGLVSDIEGTAASLASAEQAEGGAAIRARLDAGHVRLRSALDRIVSELKSSRATEAAARAAIASTAAFGRDAADTLGGMLRARRHDLRRAQGRTFALALLCFAGGLGAVLVVV